MGRKESNQTNKIVGWGGGYEILMNLPCLFIHLEVFPLCLRKQLSASLYFLIFSSPEPKTQGELL